MSDTLNPYQSPETIVIQEESPAVQGALTETMLIYLKGASPWLRFVGILGFIGAGLTVVTGFVFLVLIPLVRQFWDELPGFETFSGVVFGASFAVFFVGGGVLMVFPSLFIYRFGEKIRAYLRTGAEEELELAFKNNRSLWKFAGIVCIVQLAFIPLTIIGSIIAVAFSAVF